MKNLSAFVNEYRKQLTQAVTLRPDLYAYSTDLVPLVVDRMASAFEHRTYNHDSLAIKWTCKVLGIRHTRKAIDAFIQGI